MKLWVYNRGENIACEINRTFDEMCSTIYPISYIPKPEVNIMSNENRTPHWVPCPACNEKTDVKIYEDTVLVKFPLCCPKCGRETRIDVVKLKMVKSK